MASQVDYVELGKPLTLYRHTVDLEMTIKSFYDKLTEKINGGESSKQTRKRLPANLHPKAQIKLAVLNAATSLSDLSSLRGNRFEALRGEREGQFSIRINDRYRVCFIWVDPDGFEVEICEYHE